METFRWSTEYYHPNNQFTMDEYLNNYLPERFQVIFEDGTYAEIQDKNTGKIWGLNASGDGDSFNHKIEFEFIH